MCSDCEGSGLSYCGEIPWFCTCEAGEKRRANTEGKWEMVDGFPTKKTDIVSDEETPPQV